MEKYGGRGGIRTPGAIARTTLFESAPFDHSGTLPVGADILVNFRLGSSQLIKPNGVVIK